MAQNIITFTQEEVDMSTEYTFYVEKEYHKSNDLVSKLRMELAVKEYQIICLKETIRELRGGEIAPKRIKLTIKDPELI